MNATSCENPELAAFLGEVVAFHRREGRTLLPFTPRDIGEFEQELGRQLPTCLRAVLTTVGLLTNPFGLLDRRRDWADALTWLVPPAAASTLPWLVVPQDLIAFADPSGSSDYQLLACDDHFGRRVFVFEHDCGSLTSTNVTLLDVLKERWQTTRAELEQLGPRHWRVQFSVTVRSDDEADLIAERIAAIGGAPATLKPAWLAQFLKMPGGVRWPLTPVSHYELELRLGNDLVTMTKEPPGASGSKVVFTLSNPEADLAGGRIASTRQALRDLGLQFAECDYGLVFPTASERRPTSC